jgi:glucose-6-phosphate dehydrogenase assembly protein OpcA
MWWQDAKSMDTPLFQGFLNHVNRIIVDSGSLTHRDEEFLHHARLIFDARRRAAFSDLNWARLTLWRDLLASFFDAPEMVHHLNRLKRVNIKFAAPANSVGVPIRALLLLGWLADKLSWKLKDAAELSLNHLEFRFRTPQSRLQVEIHPQTDTDFPAQVITEVVLISGGEKSATFSIKRRDPKDKEDCFETSIVETDGISFNRVVSSYRPDDADLMVEEVEIFGRDRTYEAAARACIELIEEIQADMLVS